MYQGMEQEGSRMKLTKNYELEMTAEEIKALGKVERTGGVADMVMNLLFGKEKEEIEEESIEEEDEI